MTTNVALLRKGLRVEYFSLAWMMVECVVAIYSGLAAWSLSLVAFGGDSFIELLSSIVVIQHLKTSIAGKADLAGHAENRRAEWTTALLLVSLIPVIGLAALYSFLNSIRPESSLLGIGVALAAVTIMPVLWFEKIRIGTASHCLPLKTDAAESATCFWMSIALLTGLLINYTLKVPWIDYLATFVILAFVGKEALASLHEVA